jgi:hypothetical protein
MDFENMDTRVDLTPDQKVYSAMFRILRTPVEFFAGYWYRNHRSYAYRFYREANTFTTLQVNGGTDEGGGLRFKIEAFTANNQSLGNINMTYNGQSFPE